MRLSHAHLGIAVVLGVTAIMAACQGDDTTGTGGSSGSGGAAGGDSGQGTGGQGGTATGGSTGTGGQGGTATDAANEAGGGTGGGTEAGPRDAGPDVSTDVSVPNDGPVASDAPDSGGEAEGAAPVVCPSPEGGEGGDAGLHVQLYSFDPGAAGAADLAAWSTFNMGAITASTDDSTPESASAGSLHANITYSSYSAQPVLESYHQTPLDFSCYSALHISVKVTSSVQYVFFIDFYVTSGAQPPGVGFYTMNLIQTNAIADGNWHDLTAPLVGASFHGDRSAITRIGFQVYPVTMQPDGGPPVPPPVDMFIDNVWLE